MIQQVLCPCALLWGDDEADQHPDFSANGSAADQTRKSKQKARKTKSNEGRSSNKREGSTKGGTKKANANDSKTEHGRASSNGVTSNNRTKTTKEKAKTRKKKPRGYKWWWYGDGEEEEDDGDDDDTKDDGNDTPHETPHARTWCRLVVITLLATFVAGLIPGQPLFIRMLSDHGLYNSVCEEGKHTCMKQELSVASAFNIAQGLSYFSNLPAGYMFDRFGGRWIAFIGSSCTFVGVMMMEIPILGVEYGYDSLTSCVFPFAICLTDVGNMFSQYCVLSLVYHLPGYHLLLLSLLIAQQQVGAILPNAFLYAQQIFQLSLPAVFALYSFLTLFALIGLVLSVPSQKQYLKKAEKVMGVAIPPRSESLWSEIKSSCRVMSVYWVDHVFFIVALTAFFTQAIMYPSLLGQYIEMLWGSREAGDNFVALLTILICFLGTSVTLIVSLASDWAGSNAHPIIAVTCTSLLLLSAFNIMGTTYFQQLVCLLCNVVSACFTIPLSMKYCVAYTQPILLGSFNGVIWTLIICGYTAEMSFFLSLAAAATTATEMGAVLLVVNLIATITFIIWVVRQSITGFPETPPKLPEDNDDGSLTQTLL